MRSGSRPAITTGTNSSNTTTKAASASITDGSAWPASMPMPRASSAVAAPVTRPSRSRTGMNSSSGSSRYDPSAPGRLERSATSRSDSRISALNAASMVPRYTAAPASRKIANGIMHPPGVRRAHHSRRVCALVR